MEVIVKKSKEKVDPRHPESTDPTHRAAAERAQKHLGKLKFESEGQKRDYERSVKANPGNVMGAPAFFPPLSIRSFVTLPEVSEEDRARRALDRFKEHLIHETELYCSGCHEIRFFQFPASRCMTCGGRFRIPQIAPQGQESRP